MKYFKILLSLLIWYFILRFSINIILLSLITDKGLSDIFFSQTYCGYIPNEYQCSFFESLFYWQIWYISHDIVILIILWFLLSYWVYAMLVTNKVRNYSKIQIINNNYQIYWIQKWDFGYIIQIYNNWNYEVEFSDEVSWETKQIQVIHWNDFVILD
jgi:hypothetical protein